MRYMVLLIVSLLAVSHGLSDEISRRQRPTHKIIGGDPVSVDLYPFLVYVDFHGGSFCTGTIIADHWVLTAAHCVVDHDGSTVVPSDIEHGYQSSYEYTARPIVQAIPHPEFYYEGAGFRHDIALVEVTQPFPSEFFAPLALADPESESLYALSGTLATAIGYGRMENDAWSLHPRHVKIPLLWPDDCRNQLEFADEEEIAHDDTLCSGSSEKSINSGDSGGPLVVSYTGDDGQTWLQVGVASIRGKTSTGATVVSVHTRVSRYAAWIQQTMSESSLMTSRERYDAHVRQLVEELILNEDQAGALRYRRYLMLHSLLEVLKNPIQEVEQ